MAKNMTPSRTAYDKSLPTGDGKPMSETMIHGEGMITLTNLLRQWYQDREDVCICRNVFLYYQFYHRRRRFSPDVFVSLDRPRLPLRDTYQVWHEGKGPDVAFEFTSQSSRYEDAVTKWRIYRGHLRVREYFLFDPHEEYLRPSLRGFRLVGRRYVPIEMGDGRLHSEVLGCDLIGSEQLLRLWDTSLGRLVPTWDEAARIYREEARIHQLAAETRAQDAQNRRIAAEERLRILRDEVRELHHQIDEARQRQIAALQSSLPLQPPEKSS